MRAELEERTIIEASSQFWEQMLAMTVTPVPQAGKFCVGPGHVQAFVGLSGAWNGSIEVRLDERLAAAATAAMLMRPVEKVVLEDTLDAVREIANMIAGVIKSSLPRPCNMTVPSSQLVDECFCSFAQSEDTMMVAFQHEAGELMVCISERALIA